VHALALDGYLRDWLDLLVRWLHVIAAIGWIGSSFYFVLLDQSLRPPADPKDVEDGVGGELWEVHGGGFYHVKKYKVAPPALPDHLAWFKWEAYATWLSGFALLVILYWFDANSYMIDPAVADLSAGAAVGISAGMIVAAWVVYDVLCRAVRDDRVLAVLIAVGLAAAAWGTGELFSARAAWLQTGAMIGTIMAGSVFFNIIPAHWELIRAKEAGRDPDPAPGIKAKRRSVHNNYFTLPVLITMLAGHFTFLTARDHSWLILVFLMFIGAWVRHFYNLRHGGKSHWWMPALAAVAVVAMAVGLRPEDPAPTQPAKASTATQNEPAGKLVFESAACGSCHTFADADASGAVGPNLDTAKPSAALVASTVANGKGGMPAFKSRLSEQEIEDLSEYVASAAGGAGSSK
jgi:uncharacterized membrane protein